MARSDPRCRWRRARPRTQRPRSAPVRSAARSSSRSPRPHPRRRSRVSRQLCAYVFHPCRLQRIIRPQNERVNGKMTNRALILITFAVAVLAASSPVRAHHGATNVYDFSKAVVLKGTITKFEWLNPHNQIYFDVTDDKGTVSHWV